VDHNILFNTKKMKALPAYELFCEISSVLGQNVLALALQENISVHMLIAQQGSHLSASETRRVLNKLVTETFQGIHINGVLHFPEDLSLEVWAELVDKALQEQFSNFFLGLKKSFSRLNPTA
jgi:hypothetical protein